MSKRKRASDVIPFRKELKAETKAQQHYILGIRSSCITFGVGSAGTGKTYIPAAMAADMLDARQVRKIVVTRPAVESGRGLGYLPGDLEDKYAPYLAPIEHIFIERYGRGWYESQRSNGNIVAIPLEHMQGHTFDNSIILFDEAQNCTKDEMFMVLTRLGNYTKIVITGDFRMQKMIKGVDGLSDAVERLSSLNDVSMIEFTPDDIVRSGIVKDIVLAYSQ